MKKINKKKLFTILGLTALGLSSVSVAIPLAVNNNQSVVNSDTNSESNYKANENNLYNGAIEFDGKAYKSVDDAAYNYLNNNPITQKKYIGDLSSAYANRDLHTIDLNAGLIREYDISKISKAYNDESSANGFTDSYEEALKSNLPIYQRIQRYDDYSGNNLNNLPTDFSVAQDNLKRNLATPHALPYYEVTKLSGEKAKINPLNEKDINRLKDIALENAKNDANSFAIEDYFSNDGKTYRNIKNFNDYGIKNNKDNDVPNNFEDFLAKTLKTDVINFLKQIKFEAVLSTHTDLDGKTWNQNTDIPTYEQKKEFYNQISFNNNYSFYLNDARIDKDKNINKLKSNKLDLFDVNNDSISLSKNAESADYFYKSFSTIEELYKIFNFDYTKNRTHTTTFFPVIMDVGWMPGPDLTFEINSENQTAEKKDFGNCLKILFGKNFNKIELKNDTGISFWKQYFPGIQGNFTYYKILASPGETTINFWQLSAGRNSVAPSGRDYSDKFIYDTYSRQVYFKFQNILYFETSDSSKKIESDTELENYFNEYMGINNNKNNGINQNNEVYKKIMQKFLINYFGVNESYKIDFLKKLPEYEGVITLFDNGYKEIVKNLKSKIFNEFKVSDGNGVSDVKQTFSHYSQGTYVNENNDSDTSKDTTIQKYTKKLINDLNSNMISNLVEDNSIREKIKKWGENSKKVITFNEKPLFFVNSNSKEYSDWELDELENISNRISILDKEENSILIDLSSTKQKTWLDFSSWKTDFLNQLKNIDENYQNVDFTTLLSGIINSTPDNNEEIKQLEYNPGIFSAFYYYEKNLNLFTNSEDKKYSNLLENVVNRIDNLPFTLDKFVTLYADLSDIKVLDDNTFLNQLEPMYYGEYFGRITDFNESFDDVKLFYTNLKDKEEQLNKMNYFYPSQITYYVDKKGNVVSIDPVDDKINLASTPTQSMYDSPDLVTKNAYNNFVLTQNTNYVFYEEKNGEKTLLKNDVEFLYTLAINNNNIIFDEYNYAFSYLKQYIIANGKALN